MKPTPRIALLAARLDSGGVADHVRGLAKALAERGVAAIALERGKGGGGAIRSRCEAQGIEWVGLHFVCYGWARYGILRSKDLAELQAACEGRRVAIYFHELWIGEAAGEPFKNRLMGCLQRRGLRRMLKTLKPERVLTSNPVYQVMLSELGAVAEVLPLSGNVPLAKEKDREEARVWLAAKGVQTDGTVAMGAVFGTVHPEWRAEAALKSWCAFARRREREAVLIALGRLGGAAPTRFAELRAALPGLRLVETGELPAGLLAGLLAECEVGFATSPWALIGKSGTVAAFLEAGLPVLVTRDDWQRRGGATPAPLSEAGLRLWPAEGASGLDWPAFLASRREPAEGESRVADTWLKLIRRDN